MALRVITKGLLLLLLCGGVQQVDAGARGAAAVRKQAESSLRVSGEIVLRPDGSVLSHTLDPQAPLGEPLSRFVGDAVGNWRFKPVLVDGKPATVKVPMSLRLVAKPMDDGKVSIARAGKPPRVFALQRVPELADLQASFGAMLADDLGALEQNYRLQASGSAQRWQLQLTPKAEALARRVRAVTLHGQNAELRCIETQPAKGDVQRTLLGGAASAAASVRQAAALNGLCDAGAAR